MKCDKCDKEGKTTLMQRGVGIPNHVNAVLVEKRAKDFVTMYSDKKIALFARFCGECRTEFEMLQRESKR